VTNVLSDVEAGDTQLERVSARLEDLDQNVQQLVVLLIEAASVLAPELGRLVHGAPLKAARLELGGVLIERAEVLNGHVQLIVEELDVGGDVLVVKLALLQNAQLLQHLALHHSHAVLFGDGWLLGFLDQVLT
jgi:hypothetical protein